MLLLQSFKKQKAKKNRNFQQQKTRENDKDKLSKEYQFIMTRIKTKEHLFLQC